MNKITDRDRIQILMKASEINDHFTSLAESVSVSFGKDTINVFIHSSQPLQHFEVSEYPWRNTTADQIAAVNRALDAKLSECHESRMDNFSKAS